MPPAGRRLSAALAAKAERSARKDGLKVEELLFEAAHEHQSARRGADADVRQHPTTQEWLRPSAAREQAA